MASADLVTFSRPASQDGDLTASNDLLDLVGIPIVVDSADYVGVHIAARNLAEDIARVSQGAAGPVVLWTPDGGNGTAPIPDAAIVVGTVSQSRLVQAVEADGKLEGAAGIRGAWEAFTTAVVSFDPPSRLLGGCSRALVIAGSDKRGAIFGVYTLTEQIGVSPWHWWADVPPLHHANVYALTVTTTSREPSIRYRGMFINDEAPCLTAWARDKFGQDGSSGYNTAFYRHVFDLLLRLKANFLWPAMWPGYPNPGASFFVDDPDNQRTADEYGIVVSTSHHEPMQRLSNEWFDENPEGTWDWTTNKPRIRDFFHKGAARAKGCESYFTLGMRGEYDREMAADDPAAIVTDVIQTQRSIFQDVYGSKDAVPQLLALYKEVQEQYETGKLHVPDDVTLLFADDNFGTIRRLPSEKEVHRKGGAGIYYHFEYVGDPRSYKWTNSNSLGKTWHQLRQAHSRGARQVWVFNVGDIKPQEVPFTLAMKMAWDIDSVPVDGLPGFYLDTASRWFGPDLGTAVAPLWRDYDRLVALRRHEHIEPTSFSALHHDEAEIVARRWTDLLHRAEQVQAQVSSESELLQASIFQLVLYPIKASEIFVTLQILLGRNQLHARQRRNTANVLARRVLVRFDDDFSLSEAFHELLGGRWRGIVSQPHYGFGDTWHAPSRDMISGLCYVQRRQNSNAIVGQMGVAVEGHAGIRPGRTNEESDRTHPSRRDLVPGLTLPPLTPYGPYHGGRHFFIFTRGNMTIHWSVIAPYPWIHLSQTAGVLDPDEEEDARVDVSIDWNAVPADFVSATEIGGGKFKEVVIVVRSEEGDLEHVHLPIRDQRVPAASASNYMEGPGYISILPALSPQVRQYPYMFLPDTGRCIEGSVCLDPVAARIRSETAIDPLTFPFYIISSITSSKVSPRLLLYFSMTLDVDPGNLMSYDLAILNQDDIEFSGTYHLLPEDTVHKSGELPAGWMAAVQDCAWVRTHNVPPSALSQGLHVLQLRLHHSNMILEKIVVDLGGLAHDDSYLGPPATYCPPSAI